MIYQSEAVPLIGYSDRLSARPGETVEFKVSSVESEPFTARLVRSISADPNPKGQGIVEEDCEHFFRPQSFPSRYQPFYPGSYAVTDKNLRLQYGDGVLFSACVFPTLKKGVRQCILSIGHISLFLENDGSAAFRIHRDSVSTGVALKLRPWYRLEAGFDAKKQLLHVRQTSIGVHSDTSTVHVEGVHSSTSEDFVEDRVFIAACLTDGMASRHFNGKIESPAIHTGSGGASGTLVAHWDFSKEIPTATIRDVASIGHHATLVNFPARGMTGSRWDATEMCWRHAPDQYNAIYFHEDDIYDFQWETDFSFTVPEGLPSGVYVMRIECGAHKDAMPFNVCAPRGRPTAKLCVLIPTFTYTVYGNHARPDYDPTWKARIEAWNAYPHNAAEHRDYGLSTYNSHSDGSGICHASHRRPLFNLRPGYLTFGGGEGSGLRHFQADSHLIGWLHAKNIAYDIITDRELHDEGVAAIETYRAVMTTSHPEYHTLRSLDALQDYRDAGGNLLYLGGNGFYWRIALHPEADGLIEIRRAEDGIRAWAAEPGEYYHAFDGSYGGLWRRNARPPQKLAGVGFSAQGEFHGSYYRRICFDPAFDWMFEGVEGGIVGDFGFSGGGAAGFELDRVDDQLGTPENTVVLARSEGHGDDFVLVPEEVLTHLTNLAGVPTKKLLRADMVYFDVPGGGSVFSTGSITFCGSLPWNGFDNNVSTILANVTRRVTD